MRSQLLSRENKMVLGLAVWVCTLPIAFAVAFFFGLQAGIVTAMGLLGVMTALCWILCGSLVVRRHPGRH